MHARQRIGGFTLLEVLVAIGILSMLAMLGMVKFMAYREATALTTTAQNLVSELERARADAISGKGGEAQGVAFTSTSYIRFGGNSYNPADADAVESLIDARLTLASTFDDDEVTFARLFGTASEAGTITLAVADDEDTSVQVVIGAQGDVTLVRE